MKSPVDGKEYQFYDFTESRHLDFFQLVPQRVLIRPEYEMAYNLLKDVNPYSRIIITGQPGIGELCVVYAIRHHVLIDD